MLTVHSLFAISRLRNCSYSVLINPLRNFNIPCVRQMKATVVSYTVYGKKTFPSKESNTEILQSIISPYSKYIISS